MVVGAGHLRAEASRGRTVITHARSASPLRLLCPRVSDRAAWVVTATLGGGLVGGDRIELSIDVEDDARVVLTTQSATKIYRSSQVTRQSIAARIGGRALLASLPDPVIAFAASTFEQQQRYDLDEGASLLVADWLLAGRHARGERWAFDRYASRIDIRRSGRPIFYDHLRLSQSDGAVQDRMRRFNAYGILIATGPLFEPLASSVLAVVSARDVSRDEDVVMAAAPVERTGVVLRTAAVTVERAANAQRDLLKPIAPLLGADVWARRW